MIPVIDISSWVKTESESDAERNEIAKLWDKTFRTIGVAAIIGHGIDESTITDAFHNSADFFEQPLETKLKYQSERYTHSEGGYTAKGIEAVERFTMQKITAPPDPVESLLYTYPPKYKSNTVIIKGAQDLFDKSLALVSTLHKITAHALNIDLNYLNSFYNPLNSDLLKKELSGYYLRYAYYPPLHNSNIDEQYHIRYGAHTDCEAYTILKPDPTDWIDDMAGGLEVQLPSGDFIPVKIPKNAFIILSGDILQIWTNGKYLSPMHRVINPSSHHPLYQHIRQSIVFFASPHPQAVIQPLSQCLEKEEVIQYEPVICGEFIKMKLGGTE